MNTQQRRRLSVRAGLSPARGAPRAKQLYFAVRSAPSASSAVNSPCRGLTLIELLIVIVILGVVTVATIPIVLPALDSRRIRESARLLSTQLAAAQMQAISTGRPAGLLIERLPGDNTGAMDLSLCDVPTPYAGDTVDSVVNVQVYPLTPPHQASFTVNMSVDGNISQLLKPGDVVQFGYRGPLYRVLDKPTSWGQGGGFPTNPPKIEFEPVDKSDLTKYRCLPPVAKVAAYNQNCFPPNPPVGWYIPFQIHRQPTVTAGFGTRKSASQAVQLPAGTVVDLTYSGVSGNTFTSPLPTGSLVIMFAPTGALQDVYFTGQAPTPVDGPVHLLVGKREKLTGTETDPAKQNLYDLENIWVSVNPQTGLTTSAEMASVPEPRTYTAADIPQHVQTARQFATSAQGMGGR